MKKASIQRLSVASCSIQNFPNSTLSCRCVAFVLRPAGRTTPHALAIVLVICKLSAGAQSKPPRMEKTTVRHNVHWFGCVDDHGLFLTTCRSEDSCVLPSFSITSNRCSQIRRKSIGHHIPVNATLSEVPCAAAPRRCCARSLR